MIHGACAHVREASSVSRRQVSTMAAVVGGSHFHQAELTTMLARWNSCSHYSLGRWRGRLWAACRCGLRQRRAAWQRERPAKRALTPCDRFAADWSKACGFFEANPEATVVLTTQAHAARKRICDIDACFFRNYFICLCHMSCITCMYVCVYVCMYVCRHVVSSYILMEVSK